MKLVKGAWKLLVGIKDALVLILVLLFFGALYTLLSSGPNPGGGKGGALLLALDGPIVEQAEAVDPRDLLVGQAPIGKEYELADVLQALKAAATDDKIKTVVLDLDRFSGAGQVSLENVGEALDKVRAAKKPVLAYATGYSDASYLLAAHADEVWLDPMGAAAFAGPGGSRPYFKGLIDRLGVNVHVYRVGKYKSFVEPYTLTQQSPEAKAANEQLAGALWSQWQEDVGKARPKAQLAGFVANPTGGIAAAGGSMAKAALAAGIVDKLGDRSAFEARVAQLAGEDADGKAARFRYSALEDYVAAHPASTSGQQIGIITIAGNIVEGQAPPGTAGGDTIARLITDGLAKNNLKALVVRVDSPGGSALASERMRIAIASAKAKGLPIVVSMGNVAASGGYWVTTTADRVYAEPSTITGSIGVFGIIPTFEAAIGKYGVTTDGVKTTPLSGQPDILGGTNPTTDALIQAGIDNTYARFLELVSAGRKLPIEKVAEIAQGRVWDGGTARQLGLVDAFGSLDDAVAEAARRANIDASDVSRVYLRQPQSFWASLWSDEESSGGEGATDLFSKMVAQQQALLVSGLMDAKAMIDGPAVQARCLECPPVSRARPRTATSIATFTSRIFSWLN